MDSYKILPIIMPDIYPSTIPFVIRKIGLSIDYTVVQAMRLSLESIYYRNSGGAIPMTSNLTFPIVIAKYFLSQTWPFILALAIALRMTRVTADVTEWPI